ncbi:MAG: hypothetical protein N3A38_09035 [Planctomycetota bacterium]|nr:hypothetical protein [Planctomycetota bacterium]
MRAAIETMREWCRGRSWAVRLPLLAYFAWVGVRQVMEPSCWSLFAPLNLAIHEAGHLLFRFDGEFLCVAGGTLLQLAAPAASAAMFIRQRDYFAVAACSGWLSTNLYDVGVYMADARAQALDLVTVGDPQGPIRHDWNYMLGALGLIEHDRSLGWLVRQAGLLAMLVCLAGGGWLLWNMFVAERTGRKAGGDPP